MVHIQLLLQFLLSTQIWSLTIGESGVGEIEFLSDLQRHQRAVNAVRFSPNGELLASGDDGIFSHLNVLQSVMTLFSIFQRLSLYYGHLNLNQRFQICFPTPKRMTSKIRKIGWFSKFCEVTWKMFMTFAGPLILAR